MAGTAFSTANWSGYITHAADITHATADLDAFSLIIDIAELVADDEAADSDWVGAVQSDGGDIRCTDESDTELPFDLIDWDYNSGSPTGLIRVKRSLTANTSTQKVRVWVGTTGTAVAYTASETYGSDNAYDANWVAYWPLGGGNDRTANSLDGTASGGLTVGGVTGPDGRPATSFDGSDDYISVTDGGKLPDSSYTYMSWIYPDNLSAVVAVFSRYMGGDDDLAHCTLLTDGKLRHFGEEGTKNSTDVHGAVTTWSHCVWQRDGGTSGSVKFWGDGDADTGNSQAYSGGVASSNNDLNIAARPLDNGQKFKGDLSDIQIHSTARTTDWIAHEYAQTDDNATFWGAWSWAAASGGTPSGYADVSATASIAAFGTTEPAGYANVSATATIAAFGTTDPAGSADVAATTAITAFGTTSPAGSADVSATSAIAAYGTIAPAGSADVSATATIAAFGTAPAENPTGYANVSATATIAAYGTTDPAGYADVSATATITAVGTNGSAATYSPMMFMAF